VRNVPIERLGHMKRMDQAHKSGTIWSHFYVISRRIELSSVGLKNIFEENESDHSPLGGDSLDPATQREGREEPDSGDTGRHRLQPVEAFVGAVYVRNDPRDESIASTTDLSAFSPRASAYRKHLGVNRQMVVIFSRRLKRLLLKSFYERKAKS
jgi:hypothetical protein